MMASSGLRFVWDMGPWSVGNLKTAEGHLVVHFLATSFEVAPFFL
jgi:hypothetical protein